MSKNLPSTFREPWLEPLAKRMSKLKPNTIRVGYFYEVPDSGSFRYRAYNMAQTLNTHSKTHSASYFFLSDIPLVENFSDHLDVLVLVRFRFSGILGRLIDKFRASQKPVYFDIDDLLFDAEHAPLVAATLNFGIEPGLVLDNWYALAARLGHTLALCDAAITTTPTLAREIESKKGIPATTIPNFLNVEQLEASASLSARPWPDSSEQFRIGYFSGSKSHAKDFDIAVPGISDFLRKNPQATLVVAGILDIPGQLADLHNQIERLPFMDYVSLQTAISQVDVNIVPLQENLFTDSKSELKFFEAGIVRTVTLASPTDIFRRVIENGINGFLSPADSWFDLLEAVNRMDERQHEEMIDRAHQISGARYTGQNAVGDIVSTLATSR